MFSHGENTHFSSKNVIEPQMINHGQNLHKFSYDTNMVFFSMIKHSHDILSAKNGFLVKFRV